MHQVVFSTGICPGMVKIDLLLKVATIAMKLAFDFLDSLCSLFLKNLILVGRAAVGATIRPPRFSRYSASYCSGILVVPHLKVHTACLRKEIPAWRLLVVLQVVPVSTEIWRSKALMLPLILDASTLGPVVTTMLPFLLKGTPIGRANLSLHLVVTG